MADAVKLIPVEGDPFAAVQAPPAIERGAEAVGFVPVDGDPFAPTEQAPEGVQLSDYARSMQLGLNRIGVALGKGLQALGLDKFGGDVAASYREASAIRQSQMSPAYREEMQKPFTVPAPEGDKGVLGSGLRAGPGMTSVPKILGTAAESVPATAAGMGAGAGLAAGLGRVGLSPAVAGAVGYGAGEAGISAGMSAADIHDTISQMPEDVLVKSPEYQQLYWGQPDGTADAERRANARAELAASAARSGAIPTAISTFLLSAPAGAVFGRMFSGAGAKSLPGKVLEGMGTEALQEAAQSGPEQYFQNLALRRANPEQKLSEGVAENIIGGALGGAMLGAGGGVVAQGVERMRPQVQEQQESAGAPQIGRSAENQQVAQEQAQPEVTLVPVEGDPFSGENASPFEPIDQFSQQASEQTAQMPTIAPRVHQEAVSQVQPTPVPEIIPEAPQGVLQGKEAQAVKAGPSIAPEDELNGITRAEAGRLMAEGDETVAGHVREAVAQKGRMPVQDAVRNEALRQVAEAPAGPERERVRQNIAKVQPLVNEALSGQVADLVEQKTPQLDEASVDKDTQSEFEPTDVFLRQVPTVVGGRVSSEEKQGAVDDKGNSPEPKLFHNETLDKKQPKFRANNLPDEWYAARISAIESKGKNAAGFPGFGVQTGEFSKRVIVPIEKLLSLKGYEGDKAPRKETVEKYEKAMESGVFPYENKKSGDSPRVDVDYTGKPWLFSGEAQIAAAQNLGWENIPVEIGYWTGGQKNPAPGWTPEEILAGDALARKSIERPQSEQETVLRPDNTPWPLRQSARRAANRAQRSTGIAHEVVESGTGFGIRATGQPVEQAKAEVQTEPTTQATIPEGVEVKKDGTPMTRSGANLAVNRLFRAGINAEPVQLDRDGKAWGVQREVVEEVKDTGPKFDKKSQKDIRAKIENAVSVGKDGTRDYDAIVAEAERLVDEDGVSIDDAYEVVNQIDEEQGTALKFSRRQAFFSPTMRAVEAMDFKAMPAADLVNRIQKTQGIKQEELDDLGLIDWLNGTDGKVSKEQVLAFIEAGGPQIEEVVKGKTPSTLTKAESARLDELLEMFNEPGFLGFNDQDAAEFDRLQRKSGTITKTKFGQYQLPGGENYREVLLTLPSDRQAIAQAGDDFNEGRITEAEYQARISGRSIGAQEFRGQHWSEPNVLAHFRLNDRTDSEGRRTLSVEEIQSDWHQAGRKQGYRTEGVLPEGYYTRQTSTGAWVVSKPNGVAVGDSLGGTEQEALLNYFRIDKQRNLSGVPNAPFKKSWAMLAFKRVLRMAAEEGYDAVAWTPGAVQAERYDLSKQINLASAIANGDGTYNLVIEDKSGNEIDPYRGGGKKVTPQEMEDTIGKDLSKKLIEGADRNKGKPWPKNQSVNPAFFTLRGLDLKVGGEGMKGFYDRILPKEIGKYVGKLDKAAKVGTTELQAPETAGQNDTLRYEVYDPDGQVYDAFPTLEGAEMAAEDAGPGYTVKSPDRLRGVEVWSLPITDKLREAVMAGQPIYSRANAPTSGTPVESVQAVIAALDRIAVNAPDSKVVASADQLPEHIRSRSKAMPGYPEAVFDPQTDTSYFVANGIISERRAAELWYHESGAHNGLPGLFPSQSAHRNIMDAVYRSMPLKERNRIHREHGYGKSLEGRLQVAEEHIAQIAEKVRMEDVLAGGMTDKEKGIWSRFVAAIRRAFKRLAGAVLGRQAVRETPLSEQDIAQIALDAVRWSVTGKPSGESRRIYEQATGEQLSVREGEGVKFSRTSEQPATTFTDAETEARFQEARKGIGDRRGVREKVNDATSRLVNAFRYQPNLPKDAKYAEAREILRQVQAAPSISKAQAINDIDYILSGREKQELSKAEYDLFSRKVILDDLAHEVESEHLLPFGFTPETVAQDKAKVDAAVEASPSVQAALERRVEVQERIKKDLIDSGVMSAEQFKNPAYFRHQVLTYAMEQRWAQGGKLRRPKPGYAKKREGSLNDINANYLEAEFEYMHRALIDTRIARAVEKIAKEYDKKPEAMAQAEKWNAEHPEDKRTWRQFLPEGYAEWSPERGNLFYLGKSEAQRIADDFVQKAVEEGGVPGVTQEDLQAIMEKLGEAEAMRGRMFNLVIPEEIALTMEEMQKQQQRGMIDEFFRKPLTMWKQWVLMNPRRVVKYNLNNLSGDLDAVIAGNPRALKKLPRAIVELYRVMKGGEMTPRMVEAMERGVFDTGLTVQEIPEIQALDKFARLKAASSGKTIPLRVATRIWRTLKDYTQWRENWLRYATYLDYVERLEAGESMKSIGYGASHKVFVDGLSDVKDKAGLLSRELVGDYGAISQAGKEIRSKLIPFYSWVEVNTGRYVRLINNAFAEGVGQGFKTAGTLGAIKGIKVSAWLGFRMALMYGMIQAWNHLFFPDEEDELSAQDKVRLHLILGRDSDGKVITMRFQGALSDFMQWVGFEDAVGVATEIGKGRAGYDELVKTVLKAPVNKVVGGITPLIRTPVELAAKRSFWPDVFKPRVIRNRGRELTRLFSLENEYDALTKAPTRGYWPSWVQSLAYRRDSGETAYNNIRKLKYDYIREVLGREGMSDYTSARSEALREYRMAKRYGDREAERAALRRLSEMGVKRKDLKRSLNTQSPLYGLKRADRVRFLKTLTEDERKQLKQAEEWFRSVYMGRGQ